MSIRESYRRDPKTTILAVSITYALFAGFAFVLGGLTWDALTHL